MWDVFAWLGIVGTTLFVIVLCAALMFSAELTRREDRR